MKPLLHLPLAIASLFFTLPTASAIDLSRDTLPPVLIGGVPAVVVAHKNLELNFFNALNTQQIDTEVNAVVERSRASRLSHVLQINYGASKNNRWNVGLEAYYTHVRSDLDEGNSPLKVLGSDETTGLSQRAVSAIGLRLKGYPLRKIPELTLQSSLLFPTAGSDELRLALDFDRVQWQIGANFYNRMNRWLHGFFQVDGIVRFSNSNREQTSYLLPVNLYLVAAVLENQLYLFPSFSYGGNFEKTFKGPLKQINYQVLMGLGLHYRFSDQLSLTAAYQFPLAYDLGSLRSEPVNGSYWGASLGVRYVIGF